MKYRVQANFEDRDKAEALLERAGDLFCLIDTETGDVLKSGKVNWDEQPWSREEAYNTVGEMYAGDYSKSELVEMVMDTTSDLELVSTYDDYRLACDEEDEDGN